eukprot:g21245.t1
MEIDDLPAGVTKQTTRHPPSRKFLPPYEGDKVEVRFTFSFAGRQLHSTGAETTKFKVGEASVHAVDMAVQHMYKGEHADFTLPTSMLDAEDTCIEGPVSTAKLEVELVACKLDGTVLRKRLKELNGEDRVHDTGRVRLRVLTVTSNGEKVAGPVELSFRAGDGEVCDALEGAVLGMKEGEEAMLRVLDPAACEGLVAEILEAPIMLHLLILSVQKVPQKWDMTFEERLDRAVARKSDASRLFQEKRMRLAAKHYEEMASFFVRPEDFKDGNGNHSVSGICVGEIIPTPTELHECEEPEQPKALFRRAKALTALKEHQAALEDVKRLRDLEPKNLAAQKLLREVKEDRADGPCAFSLCEELRRQDRDSSETFSKMCTGLGELPERERREDQLVVAPDLDEEYAKLARETGVPLNRLKQVKYTLGLSIACTIPILFELILRLTFRRPVHEQTAFKSLQGMTAPCLVLLCITLLLAWLLMPAVALAKSSVLLYTIASVATPHRLRMWRFVLVGLGALMVFILDAWAEDGRCWWRDRFALLFL